MPKFSEGSRQRLKARLTGRVREPFAVITSIEQKRGAKLAEHGVALTDAEWNAVKGDVDVSAAIVGLYGDRFA